LIKVLKEREEKVQEPGWLYQQNQTIQKLTIYPVIKFLIIFIYRVFSFFNELCYKIGWYTVYGFRFIFIFFAKLFGPSFSRFQKHRFEASAQVLQKDTRLQESLPFVEDIFEGIDSEKEELVVAPQTVVETIDEELEAYEEEQRTKEDFHILPRFRLANLKSSFYFALILAIFILPIKGFSYYQELQSMKGRVLGVSESAIEGLVSATKSVASLDFDSASDNFNQASNNFDQAQEEIKDISGILSTLGGIIPNNEVRMASEAELILEAGELSAQLGQELTLALKELQKTQEQDVRTTIENFYIHIGKAGQYMVGLESKVIAINPNNLPSAYVTYFIELKDKVGLIKDSLLELVVLLEDLQKILGFEQEQRYLLVFQNNTEKRASGGFMGSYALVDIMDGVITNLEVPGGGTYDPDAGLYDYIAAPEPLQLINPRWYFRDANWWPDWSMSAKKIMQLFEKSGGPTVDGVISLTPTVLERLLEIFGPVDMTEEYGVEIDKENFWLIIQDQAEQQPEETREPKKIIGDLLDKLLKDIPNKLNKDTIFQLIHAFENNFAEKHILFYFSDPGLERNIINYGWAGEMKETNWDYLMVVNTNIGGFKSDKVIDEKINLKTEVLSDGSIFNTVTVTRTHNGVKGENFVGHNNVDWMRFYVPLGSEFVEASGFTAPPIEAFEQPEPGWIHDNDLKNEMDATTDLKSGTKIYEENGKTVFANWSQVDPSEATTTMIKYILPFKIELNEEEESEDLLQKIEEYLNPDKKELVPFALFVQKQPGSIGSEFTSELTMPENYNIVWNYPSDEKQEGNVWSISDTLDVDKYWAIMLTIE
jgi:hypothetical protein